MNENKTNEIVNPIGVKTTFNFPVLKRRIVQNERPCKQMIPQIEPAIHDMSLVRFMVWQLMRKVCVDFTTIIVMNEF